MEIADLKRTVRRASRGDENAAGDLFDHYYPRVYGYALGKLHNTADAEDVAAETFARVLRELDRFKWTGGGFEAWIFRIASNLVTDRFRATGREDLTDKARDEAATDDSPEQHVVRGEIRDELVDMMSTLPPDQREVLLLRFAAGLSTHETARMMRRKTNAVRQLQFRALQSLRTRMGAEP
ncbi:MAG: sigma-70 family RNA polymerase sigma factor [Actinomycetota bacterium]